MPETALQDLAAAIEMKRADAVLASSVAFGELTLTVDGVTRVLSAGEALRFAADCPHAYRNESGHSVRFHDLIHYPHSRP